MKQSIILGIGTGRCGTASLAKILHQQPDTVCSSDEPPFLPWRPADGQVARSKLVKGVEVLKYHALAGCATCPRRVRGPDAIHSPLHKS